ncbi:heme-binding protein 2 [Cajanus cajan]|uniref:Heme-binding protein 2 n=1 Tax=Cajanus cajan TaxID=3821 RepID=A0A151SA36_CAJCA|nr:heme-binding protein 2 [Cajanus cajan]KYP51643.1 Heme-binding protein 2 [Cajanus cajan]
MAATMTWKLSLLLSLLSVSSLENVGAVPPTCKRIECPSYDVIQVGNGYEIRRYNSPVWISNTPIQDISLVEATRTGFLRLFDYIQGKNNYKQKIEMTGPVISEVLPSDGPFCESSFVVSFYVPKENQANPPPAKGLQVQRWKTVYAAVRQFGGFVKDTDVGEEAAALKASIAGTKWGAAVEKSKSAGHASVYTVAQYNAPFEYDNRVNEIWFLFDIESGLQTM